MCKYAPVYYACGCKHAIYDTIRKEKCDVSTAGNDCKTVDLIAPHYTADKCPSCKIKKPDSDTDYSSSYRGSTIGSSGSMAGTAS